MGPRKLSNIGLKEKVKTDIENNLEKLEYPKEE